MRSSFDLHRFVPVLAVLSAFVWTSGCGGGDDGDDGDDGIEEEQGPYDGPTEWVADDIRIGAEDEGFDLDNHATQDEGDPVGCGQIDGANGVDNQLGPLLESIGRLALDDFDGDALLREAIDNGRILLLVRAVGLDTIPDDPDVDVHFFFGEDADDDLTNNLGGDGELLVEPRSLEDPTDLSTPVVVFADADVSGRVLEAGPARFQLSLPLQADAILDVPVSEARIRWSIDRDGTLTDGLVGGHVAVTQLLDSLAAADLEGLDPKELGGFLTTLFANQADIDAIPEGPTDVACAAPDECGPGQTCEGNLCQEPPGNCDALSIGIVLHAVPAEIVGIGAP